MNKCADFCTLSVLKLLIKVDVHVKLNLSMRDRQSMAVWNNLYFMNMHSDDSPVGGAGRLLFFLDYLAHKDLKT